jgi:hypothetical protein
MGHPQVRWLVWLMTQDGLMPSQLQGAGALPRNRVECAFFQWRPQLPDPDDEMVLELAANGRADTIVTVNTRDFRHLSKQGKSS